MSDAVRGADDIESGEAVEAMLAELWERMRPVVRERLVLLERAAASDAPEALRVEGAEAAHKLSGSLGSYGFPEGSRLAARAEAALRGAETAASVPELVRRLRDAVGMG